MKRKLYLLILTVVIVLYIDNSEEARNLEEQWIDNTSETLADGSK